MPTLTEAVFSIDTIPDMTFQGYSYGDSWNGFACPLFDKFSAEAVLSASESNGYTWVYDAKADAYIVRHEKDPTDYEPEQFEGQEVSVDERSVKLYAIGAYAWTWSQSFGS